jgi:hypothetical protein
MRPDSWNFPSSIVTVPALPVTPHGKEFAYGNRGVRDNGRAYDICDPSTYIKIKLPHSLSQHFGEQNHTRRPRNARRL